MLPGLALPWDPRNVPCNPKAVDSYGVVFTVHDLGVRQDVMCQKKYGIAIACGVETLWRSNCVNIIARRVFKQCVSIFPNSNGNLTPATFQNMTTRPQKNRVFKSNLKVKCCGFPQDFLRFETTENHRLTLNFVFCRRVQSSLRFGS